MNDKIIKMNDILRNVILKYCDYNRRWDVVFREKKVRVEGYSFIVGTTHRCQPIECRQPNIQ